MTLIVHPKLQVPHPLIRLTEKERWERVKTYRDPRRVGRWYMKDGVPVSEAAKAEEKTRGALSRTELKRQRAAAKAHRRTLIRAAKLRAGLAP